MSTRFLWTSTLCGFSTGLGVYLGVNIGKSKSYHDKNPFVWPESSNDHEILDMFPTVSASMNLPTKSSQPSTAQQGLPANRVSEIMKHGFPTLEQIRSYDNFVLSYDRRTRNAYWVCEHIKEEHVTKNSDTQRSKSQFVDDSSIHEFFRATNNDFKNSGYDRGHLAAAANHRYSQKAMDQTFILSNISPQVGEGFNRDAWNDLEKYTRALARKHKNVYCCTGPLYLPRRDPNGKLYIKYEVIGTNSVAVPTHFFKVVLVDKANGQFEILPFVLPNQPCPKDVKLKSYLVPLESVERAAGFLIFDKVPRKNMKAISA